MTGRNEVNLEAARQEFGSKAHVVRSDATIMADIDALKPIVEEKSGKVELLFIHVGTALFEPFEQVTEESYARQFQVNTKGHFSRCNACFLHCGMEMQSS
ncbi:hypothetical protein KTH_57250 [Thermosporothrix hazakensis]|nr:hypothetical protein KTH_57250 [Thermosporothrix hazakensis]